MFEAYSTSHLVVLAIFVAGVVVLLALGPRVRGRPAERRIATVLAGGNIAFGLAGTATELVPFDVDGSLPLQICDFAWVVVAWGLLTRHPVAMALTYYWGLTLALQALVQPTLTRHTPTRTSSRSGASTCFSCGARSTSPWRSGTAPTGAATAGRRLDVRCGWSS